MAEPIGHVVRSMTRAESEERRKMNVFAIDKRENAAQQSGVAVY